MYPHLTGFWHSLPLRHSRVSIPSLRVQRSNLGWGAGLERPVCPPALLSRNGAPLSVRIQSIQAPPFGRGSRGCPPGKRNRPWKSDGQHTSPLIALTKATAHGVLPLRLQGSGVQGGRAARTGDGHTTAGVQSRSRRFTWAPTTDALASGMSPQRLQAGESRGGAPLWQEVWRTCLHKPRFFTSPFLEGRGPGGWSEPPSRPSPKSQDSRGPRHLAGAPESAPQPQQPTATHPSPTPPNPLPYPMRPD